MTRAALIVAINEHLANEKKGIPVTHVATLGMQALAQGRFDAFERLTASLPTEARDSLRALAGHTVLQELAFRLLPTSTPRSKRPPPFDAWHPEIRAMIELLIGPRLAVGR
jgi:hypothetical protein